MQRFQLINRSVERLYYIEYFTFCGIMRSDGSVSELIEVNQLVQ